MKKLILFTILIQFSLFAAETVPENGKEAELIFDKGNCKGVIQGVSEGDVEAVRFSSPAPAEIIKISFLAPVTGEYKFFFWNDNGAHLLDLESEISESITVSATKDEWTEVDLSAKKIKIDAITSYWVGHIIQKELHSFCVADADGESRGILRMTEEDENGDMVDNWYNLGDDTYAVRMTVKFQDVVDSFQFTDISEESGLGELGNGRVAFGDYNNDGYVDLLYGGCRLFENNGDRTFTEITEKAGLSGCVGSGGVWGDIDNDGFLDFYTHLNSVEVEDSLWKNSGDGTFKNISKEAGNPTDLLPSEAAAWGDMNNDGLIDLYVANYETPGDMSDPNIDFLWLNGGGSTFTDISLNAGIYEIPTQCGRGVNWGDYNQDGNMDIFVSNYRLDMNFLFTGKNSLFFDVEYTSPLIGKKVNGSYGHTIGSQWADFDNDGDWDIFNANLAHPRFMEFSDKSMLFENSGAPDFNFVDIREDSGITYAETHSDPAWGDFDNDGFLDLFITSIYEGRESFLYLNNGDKTFTNVNYPSGLVVYNGWGSAWADIDNDGNLDLFSNGLFINNGSENNWIKIKLSGIETNAAAIGTTVTVKAGDLTIMRMVEGGKGTGCQSDLSLHFGIGKNEIIDEITILWLGEKAQTIKNIPANRYYFITETDSFDPESDYFGFEEGEVDDSDGDEVSDEDATESKNNSGCSLTIF